jgi:hypothetical protein
MEEVFVRTHASASKRLWLVIAAGTLVASGCVRHTVRTSDIGPFRDFVAATEHAQASDYLGKPGVRVVDTGEFEKMKTYLVDRYRDVHVAHSFHGIENAYVDCFPILEQPSIKNLRGDQRTIDRKGPPILDQPHGQQPLQHQSEFSQRHAIDLTLKAGVFDAKGNERFCHGDTIPIQRITLDDVTHFPSLAAFFQKGERSNGNNDPADAQHYYARGVQFVGNLGADSWLNVWSPSVASDRMSLSQIWVVADEGSSKQTAEAGWQVYPGKWHSDNAALFIYYTKAGYQKDTGCYNTECEGFKQVANNVYLGSGFDHYSATDQTQWGFELQYKRGDNGDWWLFYRGPGDWIPVGYYPKSVYGDGKLSVQAEKIAFGGEDTGEPSAKQMGSGEKADKHFGKSAYQHTIFYIDTRGTSQWATLSKEEPDPTCYTAEINNIFGAWGTYLYFGGPSCN